ncbi:MAG: isoprenyl transferase [Bacteroidota bacterium]|jgi:undecaprenyl diphosphate synthase|nr:isoprenyl transferase [Bacteroidota bacterium]HHU96598.1 isoprenyl transferase [Petrimonas sp.]
MSLIDRINPKRLPAHVAIIMDGNGRWAISRELERVEGHKEGVASIRKVMEAARKLGIPYLTLYAFSTENWDRPAEEVNSLMDLMVHAIAEETEELKKNHVKVHCIGDIDRLPDYARTALDKCIRETASCTKFNMIIALSYSSKWELTQATRQIVREVINGELRESDIDEETVTSRLTTRGIPNPDLLIRTGGELRISNFMLWQCAYSEFYFTDTYWPDFGEEDFYKAILEFQGRERRYGKTSEQLVPDLLSSDAVTDDDLSATLN